MSDPVKNAEIEDVLSSIRRLVSEDVATRPPAPRAVSDRLVLTPSQRVPDHETIGSDESPDPETEGDPVLLTDLMADADAPEDAVADAHPEAGEEAPHDLAQLVEEEIESALKDFAHSGPSESPEARTDDASSVPEASPPQEAPDVSAPTAEEAEAEEDAAQSGDHIPEPAPTLEQKVAELEAMIAESGGDWDADAPGDGDNAAFMSETEEPLAWQDYSENDEGDEPDPRVAYFHPNREPDSEPAVQASGDDDLGAEEAPMFDEGMLRDMVAEIVRQELQGALGERITRNVRKLVRREIHRALISQHLD